MCLAIALWLTFGCFWWMSLWKLWNLPVSPGKGLPGAWVASRHEWEVPTLVAWSKAGPGGSGSGCRGYIWYVQSAWADGDRPETKEVHQYVTWLNQVGSVSKAAYPWFVKWQTVFLARRACHGHFLGGGGLPLRGDFSEVHLAGPSSASSSQKAEIKTQERAELAGTFSLSHRRDPQRPCCQTCQREMWLPPGGSIRECAYFYRLDLRF